MIDWSESCADEPVAANSTENLMTPESVYFSSVRSKILVFPSPRDGSACKRLNLYLRWMVRRDGVDLGVWSGVDPAALVIPLDAHIFAIVRRVGLTRYRSAPTRPGTPKTNVDES